MTFRQVKLILFLSGLFVFQGLNAQKVTEGAESFDVNEQGFVLDKNKNAYEHVFTLKTDTLLVKLNSDEKRIAYCREKKENTKKRRNIRTKWIS